VAFRTNRHARLFGIIFRSAKTTERSGAGTAGPCLHRGPAPSAAPSGGRGERRGTLSRASIRARAWLGQDGRAATEGVYGRRRSGAGMKPASPAQSGNAGKLMRGQLENAHGIGFVPLSVFGQALVLHAEDRPRVGIDERATANQAELTARSYEFGSISRRTDLAGSAKDVGRQYRRHQRKPPLSPSKARRAANVRWRGMFLGSGGMFLGSAGKPQKEGAAQGAPRGHPLRTRLWRRPRDHGIGDPETDSIKALQNHKFVRCGKR
jgi:hypothetical protein